VVVWKFLCSFLLRVILFHIQVSKLYFVLSNPQFSFEPLFCFRPLTNRMNLRIVSFILSFFNFSLTLCSGRILGFYSLKRIFSQLSSSPLPRPSPHPPKNYAIDGSIFGGGRTLFFSSSLHCSIFATVQHLQRHLWSLEGRNFDSSRSLLSVFIDNVEYLFCSLNKKL